MANLYATNQGSGGGGGGGGITSINGNSTPAQLIVGTNNVGVSSAAGTTTIDGVLLAPLASPHFTGTATIGATSANGFSIPAEARGLRIDGDGTVSTSSYGYLQLRGDGNANFDNYGKIFFTARASAEPVEPRRAGIEVTGMSTAGNTGMRFFTNTGYNGTYRDTALIQTNLSGQSFISAGIDAASLALGTVSSSGSVTVPGITLFTADVALYHATAFATDNTYDFGAFSDATLGRPQNAYFGTGGVIVGTYAVATAPLQLLDVRGGAGESQAQFTNTATGSGVESGLLIGIDSSGTGQLGQQQSAKDLEIYVSGTEFADNGGSILILAADAGGDTGTIGGNITLRAGSGPVSGYIHLAAQRDVSINASVGAVLLSALALAPQPLNISEGGADTVADGASVVLLTASGTLAAYTLTLPAAPRDGLLLAISSNHTVTTLTVVPNSGQTLIPTITTITASAAIRLFWDNTSSSWWAV